MDAVLVRNPDSRPVPVSIVGEGGGGDKTVNVTVKRNAGGDTVQVIEATVGGGTTTTNFTYQTV